MKPRVLGYRDLEVWKAAMILVEQVFELTHQLPDDQRFGLISQLQRAAISIPSNIAEGHAKRSSKDYPRHLKMAAGSLAEIETQLELCVRLKLIEREQVRTAWTTSQQVARMLSKLIQRLNSSQRQTPKS